MNKSGKGVSFQKKNPDSRYPLEEILKGKHPNYSDARLKIKLVRAGYVPECCNNCGFTESRITDGRIPLLLNYHDENRDNRSLENIYFLCYKESCDHDVVIIINRLNFISSAYNALYSICSFNDISFLNSSIITKNNNTNIVIF